MHEVDVVAFEAKKLRCCRSANSPSSGLCTRFTTASAQTGIAGLRLLLSSVPPEVKITGCEHLERCWYGEVMITGCEHLEGCYQGEGQNGSQGECWGPQPRLPHLF